MTTQQRIIKELHIMGAISEQTALNAKEVAELADTKQAHARLCELRDQGLVIASSRTGKNKYLLTLAGIQAAEKIEESKHDQANNASENSELADATLINEDTSQANSDANEFQYPIYKVSKANGLVVKFTDLTVGEIIQQGFDEGSIVGVKGEVCKYFPSHNDDKTWQDWTPPEAETVAVPESENPYNPPYEMMGSALIDDVVANNVDAFNRLDDVKVIERKPTFGDWIDGCPQHPYSTEWCIVKFNTKRGIAVVRELSDENSYDFETADATYLKKELIKCWMPLPDSDFIHPFDYAKDKNKAIELLDQAQIAVNQTLDNRVQYLIESREEDQNFIQVLVKQREQAEEALQKALAELAETKRALQYEIDERSFMDDLPSGSREIPPPQYNPDDVAFKKSDTVFWYTVDGIKEVFETSSDAIHAAQELVKNRKIVATIHAVASKKHAIIKPVVTTELEYL